MAKIKAAAVRVRGARVKQLFLNLVIDVAEDSDLLTEAFLNRSLVFGPDELIRRNLVALPAPSWEEPKEQSGIKVNIRAIIASRAFAALRSNSIRVHLKPVKPATACTARYANRRSSRGGSGLCDLLQDERRLGQCV